MLIKVEQRHIDCGVQGASRFCPIAYAISEVFGQHVDVYGGGFEFAVGGKYDLPKEAIQLVRDFDAGREVKPLEFEVDVNPEDVRE